MNKYYYGIRYFSGHHTTTGEPNLKTGRMSIACEIKAFESAADRRCWIAQEKLSSPCGNGGGERIEATLKMCRKHLRGLSHVESNQIIDMIKLEAETDKQYF